MTTLVGLEVEGRPVLVAGGGPVAARRATALAADGAVVVGWSESSGADAFRWTHQTGMVRLESPSAGVGDSRAFDVSADGAVVVGQRCIQSDPEAFIWYAAHGMRSLRELVLRRAGRCSIDKWKLISAKSVSQDGLAVVGTGLNPRGNREGWIAYLDDDLTVAAYVPAQRRMSIVNTELRQQNGR